MAGSLNVVTYNCRGLPKTPAKLWEKPTINMLLNDESIDILAFQETFLSKQDLSCLNVLHKKYQGIGESTTDNRDKLIAGHAQGGGRHFMIFSLSQNSFLASQDALEVMRVTY